jgi:hypothetical protein
MISMSMTRESSNEHYDQALAFAAERHAAVRQARRGTSFPYIVHPIRVGQILDRFQQEEDVVVAGLLHDTIEDAGVTYEELTAVFSNRVATLVEKASEPDRSADWQTRKQHSIDRVRGEDDPQALAVVAADKLDNVLSLRETLRAKGERRTWATFNASRSQQHWYYRTLAEALLEKNPSNLLFRTLDAEVHEVFPDDRRQTPLFAGKPLGNPHDARAYLADPIKHWRPERSAYELAHAWLAGDAPPSPVDALLRAALGPYDIVEGFFEKETDLGTKGRPSQSDLLLVLRSDAGYAIAAVEAKAGEPFGEKVNDWHDGSPGKSDRLENLCSRLGIAVDAVGQLRYQLFHRSAAALIEAERYGAPLALVLIEAFPGAEDSFDDFAAFARALGVGEVSADALSQAKQLGETTLRLGWAAHAS